MLRYCLSFTLHNIFFVTNTVGVPVAGHVTNNRLMRYMLSYNLDARLRTLHMYRREQNPGFMSSIYDSS